MNPSDIVFKECQFSSKLTAFCDEHQQYANECTKVLCKEVKDLAKSNLGWFEEAKKAHAEAARYKKELDDAQQRLDLYTMPKLLPGVPIEERIGILWCVNQKYVMALEKIRDEVEHVAKDTGFRVCNDIAAEALK